jgi:hypothetical protein
MQWLSDNLFDIVGFVSAAISLVVFFANNHEADWHKRAVHGGYAIILILLSIVIFYSQSELKLRKAQIGILADIETAAEAVNKDRYSVHGYTDGAHEGFMLAGLAFLEKHKERFPDTYKRAVVSEKATEQKPGELSYETKARIERGADAMRALLNGIAASHRTRVTTGN